MSHLNSLRKATEVKQKIKEKYQCLQHLVLYFLTVFQPSNKLAKYCLPSKIRQEIVNTCSSKDLYIYMSTCV